MKIARPTIVFFPRTVQSRVDSTNYSRIIYKYSGEQLRASYMHLDATRSGNDNYMIVLTSIISCQACNCLSKQPL